ncbi:hypothetical protein L3Q82_008017 [Scortum barcoo]|uniref:Uncharacterized protein n=1 Tax=Scortum barcoo TaxID=214431 RepID=A0ACB8WL34_9TELE|nr:hypothetical protein L3Q82_008017 [Scortum barcoo]
MHPGLFCLLKVGRWSSAVPGICGGQTEAQSHRNTHTPHLQACVWSCRTTGQQRDTPPPAPWIRGHAVGHPKVTAAVTGAIKAENAAQLVHVQPPAENKVDGVMAAALEREGEGDEAPSAEIEQEEEEEEEEAVEEEKEKQSGWKDGRREG